MKTVIEMAREACDKDKVDAWHNGFWTLTQEELARFAELVRADEREQGQKWFDAVTAQHKQAILAEREACANLAQKTVCDVHIPTGVKIYGTAAAKAIRARRTHEQRSTNASAWLHGWNTGNRAPDGLRAQAPCNECPARSAGRPYS